MSLTPDKAASQASMLMSRGTRIRRLLDALATQLCALLAETLPKLDDDWWDKRVVSRLTFQQQNFVRSSRTTSLEGLDVAALLRVLDQNWHEIAPIRSLPIGARSWLKEAQTIRNRWAHAPTGGLEAEETYRDLDTLDRLFAAVGAGADVLAEIRAEKKSLLGKLAGGGSPGGTEGQPPQRSEGTLTRGTIVRLKARPSVTGAVIDHLPGDPEDRYVVFHDGATATYYASQIERVEVPGSAGRIVSLAELNAALTALQLLHPSIANLYSLYSARINFVPYQFRPVLKLIQADRPRMLIADEVGVGKTIEAGLILKELQARRELRSVLVICPKPLVAERKWLEELKRFDEQFVHLDGDALRYCIEESHLDGVWPQQYSRAIVPYSIFDEVLLCGRQRGNQRQRGLLDLDPPPAFDLVIVDEAHHIRNTETWAYRTVRYFCDNAEAAVLMLERMSVFLRLMHEGLITSGGDQRSIDANKEFARGRRLVPQISERLKSAFPVRPEHLGRGVRKLTVEPQAAQKIRKRFANLARASFPNMDISWEPQTEPGVLLGTARLRSRVQPFSLLLRSIEACALVRCISPVGRVRPGDEQNAVVESTSVSPIRIGAILTKEERTYDLTVEGDVLLADRDETDVARVSTLVNRVVQHADALEQEYLPGRDEVLATFREELLQEDDDGRCLGEAMPCQGFGG